MAAMRDAFLSDEDLDLRHLSFAELNRVWNAWLRQAQATNDCDVHEYSHGVFTHEPVAPAAISGPGEHATARERPASRSRVNCSEIVAAAL
jgi:hypothetical protein